MKYKQHLIALLLWAALLGACTGAPTSPTTVEPTVVSPTTVRPTAASPTDVAPTEVAPASVVPDSATPTEEAAANANSPIFGTPWTDRSVYAAGLVESQQGLLDELPGAPVYHMQLEIDGSMTRVKGHQAVHYTNTEDVALDEIYFHLFPNLLDGAIEVSNVTVDGQPVTPELEGPGDILLRVPLPQPLAPGESAVVAMDFTTTVPTDIGRNYGIFAYAEDVLALAHFYPMVAVYDAEGWATETPDVQGDVTYSDTGYYLVEVTAPAAQKLVAGGVVVDEGQTDDGRQTVTYAAGPMRDFYLAASDDYIVRSEIANGIQVNSFGPSANSDGVEMALEVALATIAKHSEWLAPYPYSELDIVTTPTAALGIEYPGIIVGTSRMYDVKADTPSGVPWGVILESTTAHEVGHQWFYSLVGNDQLNEPWLDESLTTYITYRYYLDRYGPQGGEAYLDSLRGRWDRVDDAKIPVGLPVEDYDGDEYSAIVYGRGPLFVRALADEMGLATFDAFMRDYVTSNRLGIATTADFRALAESHCACDLGPIFQEWVYK